VKLRPAQNGTGVVLPELLRQYITYAYYKFTGAAVGSIFNPSQGQVSFYLQSRYSFAQRQAIASSPRYAFDVRDGNGHLFYFLTEGIFRTAYIQLHGWRSGKILLRAGRHRRYASLAMVSGCR